MAHNTVKKSYLDLADRINRFPQGAPPSDLLYRILELLFSDREAELVARSLSDLSRPTRRQRSGRWASAKPRSVLDELASRAILVDIESENGTTYALPPPMAGFFEFSMMRIRDDLDQKLLSELFYQYLNVEEDFIKNALYRRARPSSGAPSWPRPRCRPTARSRSSTTSAQRRSSKSASHIGVGVCYCRHKMDHLDRACAAPMNICMTFNTTAASLTRHGVARAVDAAECLDLVGRGPRQGLVQFGENVQQAGQLHLQLLRLLLRGDDRGPPLRPPSPGPHHQLPAADRPRTLHRLRQVRRRLPGGSDDPGVGQRSRSVRSESARG